MKTNVPYLFAVLVALTLQSAAPAGDLVALEDFDGGDLGGKDCTNHGVFGGLWATPIIHQPQAAIIATGSIKRRPIVRDDAIVIRSMIYLSLSYDHRVIDGAIAEQFLADLEVLVEQIESLVPANILEQQQVLA